MTVTTFGSGLSVSVSPSSLPARAGVGVWVDAHTALELPTLNVYQGFRMS